MVSVEEKMSGAPGYCEKSRSPFLRYGEHDMQVQRGIAMIRIHVFYTGSVVVDRAIPCREKKPPAVTGFLRSRDKKLTLPVSAYLIEHPKENVLIDAGWDSRSTDERPHRFFGLLDGISTPVIQEGESIGCNRKRWGSSPRTSTICLSATWISIIPASRPGRKAHHGSTGGDCRQEAFCVCQ